VVGVAGSNPVTPTLIFSFIFAVFIGKRPGKAKNRAFFISSRIPKKTQFFSRFRIQIAYISYKLHTLFQAGFIAKCLGVFMGEGESRGLGHGFLGSLLN
jgi:hypothetical protein